MGTQGDKAPVNLYDGHYSDHMKEAQTKVRTFTYGAGEGACRLCSFRSTLSGIAFAR